MHNAEYNHFCESNGLKRYDDRLSIAKWNRSEAMKAAKKNDNGLYLSEEEKQAVNDLGTQRVVIPKSRELLRNIRQGLMSGSAEKLN